MSGPKKLVRRINPASHGIRNLSIEEREPEREPQKNIRYVTRITEEEKRRIRESVKKPDVRYNSFYTKPDNNSKVSRFDSASNRRTAGRYIPNA